MPDDAGDCAGILKLELCDHVATISSLSFAPHPLVLLVSASMDGTLKLWDMNDDGNMIKTLRTNCTAFYGCCWSPDAMALATVGNYHSVSVVVSLSWLNLLSADDFFSFFSSTSMFCFSPLVQCQKEPQACNDATLSFCASIFRMVNFPLLNRIVREKMLLIIYLSCNLCFATYARKLRFVQCQNISSIHN